MDKKLFKTWVESVAIIKDRKPARTCNERKQYEWVTEIDESGEEVEIKKVIPLENETLGFDLIKLKTQPKLCEIGCGKIVEGQVIEKKRSTYPKPHWRTRCSRCDCYISPDGEHLIKGTAAIQAAFVRFFKSKK